MNDRELLELAAKAAGYAVVFNGDYCPKWKPSAKTGRIFWNPLNDDGDALRLAVKLEIEVRNFNGASHAGKQDLFWHTENWFPDGDPYAATRRCVTRAAAELASAADAGGKEGTDAR